MPLLERKARLFDLLPADDARLLYVDCVEGDGARFLQAAVAMDLEGVVGKYADGIYDAGEGSTRLSGLLSLQRPLVGGQ